MVSGEPLAGAAGSHRAYPNPCDGTNAARDEHEKHETHHDFDKGESLVATVPATADDHGAGLGLVSHLKTARTRVLLVDDEVT